MIPAGVTALRVGYVCLTNAYCFVTLSHISATWVLRKDFYFAVRSPLLTTASGVAGVLAGSTAVSRTVMFPGLQSLFVLRIFSIPLTVLCFVVVYILRGLRVIVMYTPSRRQRWGRYLKREAATVKVLMAAYVIVEVAAWIVVRHVGLARVASFMVTVVKIDTVVTLSASLALFGQLRRTQDVFKVSLEIQRAGACALLTSVMIMFLGSIPAGVVEVYLVLFYTARFHGVLWITNIQPAREILERRGVTPNTRGIMAKLFPYVPWRKHGGTVAIDSGERMVLAASPHSSKPTVKVDDAMEEILLCPLLLEAFEEFCRKALCSESIMFLKAARAYNDSVYASTANADTNFALFMEILDKYIKDGSPFEINIESKTKSFIMRRTDKEAFKQLPLDDVARGLDAAAKEVGKMLKENLYDKFQQTDQFKQITGVLFATKIGDDKNGS
ncbi:unnamed protein product, partial [Ectocarpus sp. 12 AP-2014]